MKSSFGSGVGDEGILLDDLPRDGRRIGWTPHDGAAIETLEMQSKNGLALAQWTIPQCEAALKDRVYLVTLYGTSGKGSLNGRSRPFAFGRSRG